MKQGSIIAGIFFITLLSFGCSKDKDPKPTGLPGDNLDLYAVLHLFETSTSVESFEKSLNSKSTGINNLDLNGDGKVDYIRVIDQHDGDAHAITLRVPVSGDEEQDVAVIEIEKTGDKTASAQIVGDEDIYGKNTIVEPKEKSEKSGFIYTTDAGVNVWYWPSVEYIYSPDYVVWTSPYYYEYYPVYYEPWPPVAYEVYYPVVYPTHTYYVAYDKHRFRHANEIYYTNRVNSGFVMERHRNGDFKGGKQMPYKGNYAPRTGPHNNPGGGPGWAPRGNGDHQNGNNGQPNIDPKGGNNQRGGGNDHRGDGNVSPKGGNQQGGNDHRDGGNVSPKGGNQQGGNDHRGGGNISPKGGNQQGGNNQRGGGNVSPRSPSPQGGNPKGGGNAPKSPSPKGSARPR